MPNVTLHDAWPDYVETVGDGDGLSTEAILERWSGYMSKWPELFRLQRDDYASMDLDWKAVARERVFPFLHSRFEAMGRAHDALLAVLTDILSRTQAALELDFEIAAVLYVGIGCGAGWAARYDGRPTVLFGLEAMAECGWISEEAAGALAAHEIAHLCHGEIRRESGEEPGNGPLWNLYEEGFAKRCEFIARGRETWEDSMEADDSDWEAWCRRNETWLAAEYSRRTDAGEEVRPFFGNWLDIRERKMCGYFLGGEMIRRWREHASLREIAAWPAEEVDRRTRRALENLANK